MLQHDTSPGREGGACAGLWLTFIGETKTNAAKIVSTIVRSINSNGSISILFSMIGALAFLLSTGFEARFIGVVVALLFSARACHKRKS